MRLIEMLQLMNPLLTGTDTHPTELCVELDTEFGDVAMAKFDCSEVNCRNCPLVSPRLLETITGEAR